MKKSPREIRDNQLGKVVMQLDYRIISISHALIVGLLELDDPVPDHFVADSDPQFTPTVREFGIYEFEFIKNKWGRTTQDPIPLNCLDIQVMEMIRAFNYELDCSEVQKPKEKSLGVMYLNAVYQTLIPQGLVNVFSNNHFFLTDLSQNGIYVAKVVHPE